MQRENKFAISIYFNVKPESFDLQIKILIVESIKNVHFQLFVSAVVKTMF